MATNPFDRPLQIEQNIIFCKLSKLKKDYSIFMFFAFNCMVNPNQQISGTGFAQKQLVCNGPANHVVHNNNIFWREKHFVTYQILFWGICWLRSSINSTKMQAYKPKYRR